MLQHFSRHSTKELGQVAALCGGIAALVVLAVMISDTFSAPVAAEAPKMQTSAIGFAIKTEGFKSYGNDAGRGAHDNPTNSNTGWPSSLGCTVGRIDSPSAPQELCVHNDKQNIFGVLSVWDVQDESDYRIAYFKADPPGGNQDRWRAFWSVPTITERITCTTPDTGCGPLPSPASPAEKRRMFHVVSIVDGDPSRATNYLQRSGSAYTGLFERNGRVGFAVADKDKFAESRIDDLLEAGFQDISSAVRTLSYGKSYVVVPIGGSVKLEWVCQPLQVNFFEEDDAAGNNKNTTGRILDLFDSVRTRNIPGVSSSDINSQKTISNITTNTTYEVSCVSKGRGPISLGQYYDTGRTISFTTEDEPSPWMKVEVRVALPPTSRIQANDNAYNTNITVTHGTPVNIRATYTAGANDSIVDRGILRDGSSVASNPSGSDRIFTYTATVGTNYTFTSRTKTKEYPEWRNGGSVTVRVVCPSGQTQSGNTCISSTLPTVTLTQSAATTQSGTAFTVTYGRSGGGAATSCTLQRQQPGGTFSTIHTNAGITSTISQTLTTPTGTWTYRAQCTGPAGTTPWTTITHAVTAATQYACNDGIDNDGDGRTDYPNDPGCSDATDPSELNPSRQCDDGIDNDSQQGTDTADPDCGGNPDGTSEGPAAPDIQSFSATPSRVTYGETTTLSWNIENSFDGCSISANPDSATFPYSVQSLSGNKPSDPIVQTTIFTLSCGGTSEERTVTVIPDYEEI